MNKSSCNDLKDEVLRELAINNLPQRARKENTLRVWQMNIESYLHFYADDIKAWRVLAELFFEDGCYINTLWICNRHLYRVSDPIIDTMKRISWIRTSLVHEESWPEIKSVEIPSEITEKWFGGDWWDSRKECIERLMMSPFNENLWFALANLYNMYEETLMGLWCILIVMINSQNKTEEEYCFMIDNSIYEVTKMFAKAPSIWCKIVGKFPNISVYNYYPLSPQKRAESIYPILESILGFNLNTSPIPVLNTFIPPEQERK